MFWDGGPLISLAVPLSLRGSIAGTFGCVGSIRIRKRKFKPSSDFFFFVPFLAVPTKRDVCARKKKKKKSNQYLYYFFYSARSINRSTTPSNSCMLMTPSLSGKRGEETSTKERQPQTHLGLSQFK